MTKKVVHLVAAARPNFMKIAPLYHALKKTDWCEPKIVRVHQHTDAVMSTAFLTEFGLPTPDIEVVPGMPAAPADAVVVPGDVHGAADYAVAAARAGIPVVHLEAGLRSFDRSMPEEINRIVIDSVSSLWWASEWSGVDNLESDGHTDRVELVGNIMIDTLEMMRPNIEDIAVFAPGPYVVATFHRPSNVDTSARLLTICHQLGRISRDVRVIFPVHPRTRKQLQPEMLKALEAVELEDPMPYVEFMRLVYHAQCVITDSGGVQEETSYLGIPCVTVRENTERPVTLQLGPNRLSRIDEIELNWDEARQAGRRKVVIPYWDGHTAARCVASLKKFLT